MRRSRRGTVRGSLLAAQPEAGTVALDMGKVMGSGGGIVGAVDRALALAEGVGGIPMIAGFWKGEPGTARPFGGRW